MNDWDEESVSEQEREYIRRMRRRRQKRRNPIPVILLFAAFVGAAVLMYRQLGGTFGLKKSGGLSDIEPPSYVDVQLISVDGAARRGEALEGVNDIVIHYVGNPGTTAQQNRDYYDNPDSEVSSHFVVGLQGEVIQCIPLNEKSSATNWRNTDTISVEACHPDESGEFTPETYDSLVRLTAWLRDAAGLGEDNIIRHYDVTEKLCPLYFVENEDAWEDFKSDTGRVLAETRRQ